MAATDVSICSNALLALGAQSINALTETSDRAKLANNLYASVRDSVQRSHPWNCCIMRVVLSPDAPSGAPQQLDWTHAFTLPPDFLKALAVGQAGMELDFRIEGRKLLCNENPVYLRYIARNENPATWDTMLVRSMELAMAAAMAYGITQSAAMRDSTMQELTMHMKRARSVDGQDDPPETLGDSPLLQARHNSAIGGWWKR